MENEFKINKVLLNDKNLNVIEKGLMVSLLFYTNDNIFNKEDFRYEKSGIGKKMFNKAFNELIKYGYIEKYQYDTFVFWFFKNTPDKINLYEWFIKNIDKNRKKYNISDKIFNKIIEDIQKLG